MESPEVAKEGNMRAHGDSRATWGTPAHLAAVSLITFSAFAFPTKAQALDSLCATVKLEIQQELTLERQAFDAHMRINNGLTRTAPSRTWRSP